ncbi:MAG: acyltransferase [Bacteroidota bacterium]|nr:acyltransferase [Bacteroidota bacterium]
MRIVNGKIAGLEVLRGLAAMMVMLGHIEGKIDGLENNIILHSVSSWGTEAVVVFFVLSGIVINISHKPGTDFYSFIKKRVVRIFPIHWFALLIALWVYHSQKHYLPPNQDIFGNLFLLANFWGLPFKVLSENAPIWTLMFEMFFYLLFGIGILFEKTQKRYMVVWTILAVVAIPAFLLMREWNVMKLFFVLFAFSSIWLVGYWIVEFQKSNNRFFLLKEGLLFMSIIPMMARCQFSGEYYDPFKYLLVSFLMVPFFSAALPSNKSVEWRYRTQAFFALFVGLYIVVGVMFYITRQSTQFASILYGITPIILCMLHPLINKKTISINKKLLNIFVELGCISYAIYIVHMPIIIYVNKLNLNVITKVSVIFSIVLLLAFILAKWFQTVVPGFLLKK